MKALLRLFEIATRSEELRRKVEGTDATTQFNLGAKYVESEGVRDA